MLPKLIILKHHPQTYLLADLLELDEEPALCLQECCTINDDGGVQPYPKHTHQRDIFLSTDDVMTILDPSPAVAKQYLTVLESFKKSAVPNE